MNTIQIINLVLGIVGTALGIILAIREILKCRIRLKLDIKRAFTVNTPPGISDNLLAISIINLSNVPIYISEVFINYNKGERAIIFDPFLGSVTNKELPLKLESRKSESGYMDLSQLRSGSTIFNAGVKTECGKIFKRKTNIKI